MNKHGSNDKKLSLLPCSYSLAAGVSFKLKSTQFLSKKKIGPLPTWPGTPLHVDFSAMRTVHNVVFHRTLVAPAR